MGKCGTRLFFLGGSKRRAGAHMRLAFPKMPTTPLAFPLLGATQQLEKHSVNTAAAVFVDRPTQQASMAQGLFYGGSGRRAVAHTRPAFPKMPTAPSAFPLLGVPQALGDEPNLPKGSKSLGGRPPEAEGNYPAAKTHPARSVPAASTAGQNATQQLEKRSVDAAAAHSTNLVLD